MRSLVVGYVPLTDAAVLIAAAEKGFAAREDLLLTLVREPSWANIRDKLAHGGLDGAHILAPLALATALGLGPVRADLVAPFALNLNGNAITVATQVWEAMAACGPADTPAGAARALGETARRRARAGHRLAFATVFPLSTHTYQLRLLLQAGGLDPERDVRLVVVPPQLMTEALRQGHVDGFCVGSPWSSVAVAAGVGRIVAFGSEIAPGSPEKVFALSRAVVDREPDTAAALIRALAAAAAWCAAPENRRELATLLAQPAHLALDPDLILRGLEGRLVLGPDGAARSDPRFLLIGGAGVHRPNPDHALWLVARIVEAGHAPPSAAVDRAALAVYAPDLYDRAQPEPVAPAGGSPAVRPG